METDEIPEYQKEKTDCLTIQGLGANKAQGFSSLDPFYEGEAPRASF